MQRSPKIMISSTVIAGVVDSGDSSRNMVGATGRDTRSTMFPQMNRWHHAQQGHEGAISDHFLGANEFSDHGRPGTRVELMVDSGSTATVCGLEHFSDTPVTIGPPLRLRASNGQPLRHYGQKKVELLSDGGEKMHATFSVHDVKRAIISTSATALSGIETHLDEWDPQRGRTVSYFKNRIGRHTVVEHDDTWDTLFFGRHCGLRTAAADRRVPNRLRV